MFQLLATSVDLVHAAAMLAWGVGLPLLFWHRFPRLSRAYLVYSIAFILGSVLSHWALGECFLTTFARSLWNAGTNVELRNQGSFVVRLVEFVAGIRPSERWAVLAWESAILVTCAASLWHLKTNRSSQVSSGARGRSRLESGVPEKTA